jgi:hypothetical protein
MGLGSVTPQSQIGLQLRYDTSMGYQVIECLPAAEATLKLPLPTPLPARLYIQPASAGEGFWEVINPGLRIKLPQPSDRIELRTIDGKRYELHADIQQPTEHKEGDSVNPIYLTHHQEDGELARHIASQLAQQGIQVTLLTESPSEFQRLKSWQIATRRLGRLCSCRQQFVATLAAGRVAARCRRRRSGRLGRAFAQYQSHQTMAIRAIDKQRIYPRHPLGATGFE